MKGLPINQKLAIVYDEIYLDWQLGAGDGTQPTNPIRAKLAVELLQASLGEGVTVVNPVKPGAR